MKGWDVAFFGGCALRAMLVGVGIYLIAIVAPRLDARARALRQIQIQQTLSACGCSLEPSRRWPTCTPRVDSDGSITGEWTCCEARP